MLTRRSTRVAGRVGRFQSVEGNGVAGDMVVTVAAAGTLMVMSTARRRGAGVVTWKGLSGDGAVECARGAGAVAA